MSDFNFGIISNLKEFSVFDKGYFLWIWYADKIPPHVACLVDGQFFSLKVNGKDESIDVTSLLKALSLKKVPTLFVRVNKIITCSEVLRSYENYSAIQVGKNTCLSPVIDLFECGDRVKKLSDLLRLLQEQSLLKEVFKLHLNEDYTTLPYYSNQDIEQRLLNLTDVKRR